MRTDFLPQTYEMVKVEMVKKFTVKRLKCTANQQHRWDRVFAIFKNIHFHDSMYRQIWEDVFKKYNTPTQSSSVVERLFCMVAASLTTK